MILHKSVIGVPFQSFLQRIPSPYRYYDKFEQMHTLLGRELHLDIKRTLRLKIKHLYLYGIVPLLEDTIIFFT